MPRKSEVKPIDVRKKQISDRVKATVKRDNLPIWEGKAGVECPVIDIPLDHLLFRLGNGRTRDAQEYAIAIETTFDYTDGTKSPAASKEIFNQDNEGNQDSQDHQFELLRVEAEKKSGRIGHENLMEIMEREGWKNTDRPVITPDGVLINGNCRVAAIEYLLQNAKTIPNINASHPIISVKVVPTPPAGEHSIDELERELQLGDKGKLEYDWIQITTDMRIKITEYSKGFAAAGESDPRNKAFETVHDMYSHLKAYAKHGDMLQWLRARQLLEKTLKSIGKKGQAYGLNPPATLFKSSIELISKGTKKEWWTTSCTKKLDLILEVMLQINLGPGKPLKELRYEIEEIKNEDDLTRMIDTLVAANVIKSEEKEIKKEGKKITVVRLKSTNGDLDAKALEKSAKAIRSIATDIKESHDDKDLENKPKKKLEEIKKNLGYYSDAMDKIKIAKRIVDKKELQTLFQEIKTNIEEQLKNLK